MNLTDFNQSEYSVSLTVLSLGIGLLAAVGSGCVCV